MKPFYLFAPIRRVDDAERTVEGYAFVREVVEGEGGLRLTRAAMERATPDYMQWGALREMHQPLAAGTTTEIQWDEQGAYIRTRIVDDAAWKKVVERVYKGFSVGVQGLVLRGNQVTACRWIEISLVDRPKDPGAVITAFRADVMNAEETGDISPAPESNDAVDDETERLSMPAEPAADAAPNDDADALSRRDAFAAVDYDAVMPADITVSDTPLTRKSRSDLRPEEGNAPAEGGHGAAGSPAPECRAARNMPEEAFLPRQNADADANLTRRDAVQLGMPSDAARDDAGHGQGERHPERDDAPASRVGAGDRPLSEMQWNRLALANAQLLQRAEMAETELATVRARLGAVTERVRFLEAQPKPPKPVVRFPGALGRDFLANHAAGQNASRAAELRGERAALLATAPSLTTQAERAAAAQRLMSIDSEIKMMSA